MNDRRVDEATGERLRFRSVVLPPYARRSPKVADVLALLYLHGLSTEDFVPALAEFFKLHVPTVVGRRRSRATWP